MLAVSLHYFAWHYTRGWRDLTKVGSAFMQAIWHYFSIGLLLKTFFSPFRRIRMTVDNKLDFEELASTFVTNLLMRFVGMLFRMLIIAAGLFASLLFLIGWILSYIVWLFLPPVLIYLVLYSFVLILT